jgi:hypothetical protein
MKIVRAIFDPGWLSRRGSSRIENDALRRHHQECESRLGHRPDRGGRPPARRITSSLDQIADVICERLHFHPAVGLILLEVARHVAGEEGLRIHPSSLPCFSISSYFGNFDRSTVSKFVPKIANSSRTSMSSYSRYPSPPAREFLCFPATPPGSRSPEGLLLSSSRKWRQSPGRRLYSLRRSHCA